MPIITELRRNGISLYGGNYEFFSVQKDIEKKALDSDIRPDRKNYKRQGEGEGGYGKAAETECTRKEKTGKGWAPKIMMNGLRN